MINLLINLFSCCTFRINRDNGIGYKVLFRGDVAIMELDGIVLYLKTEEGVFKSKIIAREASQLLIDYPVHTETHRTAFFIQGTALHASFTTEGICQQTFEFTTTVIGRVQDQVPLLIIHFPGVQHLEKLQRRAYVRVDALLDISLKLPNGNYPAVTKDISAGGLAVHLPTRLAIEAGHQVPLIIVLPFNEADNQYVRVEARIVRIADGIGYMEFTEISSFQRQQIVQFCFKRQLKMRKIQS